MYLIDTDIKNLLLALNLYYSKEKKNNYTCSLIVDYRYSSQIKNIYPSYRITIWKKRIVNNKKYSEIIDTRTFTKKLSLLRFLAKCLKDEYKPGQQDG